MRLFRDRARIAALAVLVFPMCLQAMTESCLLCHDAGLPGHHLFPDSPCTPCHAGNPRADSEPEAHSGLISRPGELHNSRQSCGGCHAGQVDQIRRSPMATGANMIRTTREVLGDTTPASRPDTLRNLGHDAADSLLRKLCVSCHLGQPRSGHDGDPVDARGGGCLACHLASEKGDGHRDLDARVGDRRCFGCHSRSGRISLNYAGLGEVAPVDMADGRRASRLGDGRLVEHLPGDVHHRAGLSCTDCHTGPGLMGAFASAAGSGVDIACADCHANANPRVTPGTARMRRGIPFDAGHDQPFLSTANGTPLRHVEVREGAAPILHRKQDGQPLGIPQLSADHARLLEDHESLTCDTCHATWAPQCFGCHLEYDPDTPQWDHLAQRETPGDWSETRWDVRNDAAPLGRRADGRIGLFVPGMILTLKHPDLQEPAFVRRFAPLHPHTTGGSRNCRSCHRDPRGLGLGAGDLTLEAGGLKFLPARGPLQDGLPADGFATLEPGRAHKPGTDRPLSPEEITRIFQAPLPAN